MATTINTGWRTVTPGPCHECGSDDEWQVDGRGNVLCGCQACPDCGIVDAYGFHEPGCPTLAEGHEAEESDPITALIAAERAATKVPDMEEVLGPVPASAPPKSMTMQAQWCSLCCGPLDVHDVDTCESCRGPS